jgi:hypothetical protein
MTDCTQRYLPFSSVGKKKIQADFQGGHLTSDTGVLLLRETDKRLGLIEALADCLLDPRHPSLIKHSQREMLAQRIFAIALGYEDLNDHATLRHDPALQVATERIRKPIPDLSLSSPSTLCRLENRIDRKSLARIAEIFVEQFIASFREPPEELILDFDATDDPLHGHQENRFFHGYYDCYCYLPLYVFCGDQLLCAYLRPSGIDASKHSLAILMLLVRRFREVWPEVRIVFRGDSGFCRWKLMRWCEKHDVSYILGLARNPVLESLARPWTREAELSYQVLQEKQRIFNTFRYAAKTWDKKRRVIVKAEHLEKGPNTRFVVTNLKGASRDLYDKLYCQRGEMENRIKEQQLGLFADRTSCHAFLANQFRLFLSAAAYVLIDTIRREALKDTELCRAQVNTIRIILFKIASRVVKSVRRIVFHMATGYPYQTLFSKILRKLRTQPSAATSYR